MDDNVYIKKKEAEDTICLKCMEENIPFQKITNNQFFATASKGVDTEVDYSNLSILPPENIRLFFKQLNEYNGSNIIDEKSPLDCKYYDTDTFPSSKVEKK